MEINKSPVEKGFIKEFSGLEQHKEIFSLALKYEGLPISDFILRHGRKALKFIPEEGYMEVEGRKMIRMDWYQEHLFK